MSDLRSRVLGTIFGTLSRGSFPKREPVAFLYNGVRLPGLPDLSEQDKKVYRFVYITKFLAAQKRSVTFSPVRMVYDPATGGVRPENGEPVTVLEYSVGYYGTPTEWGEPKTVEIPFSDSYTRISPFWANTDILNEDDGTVYLAASEPVPVYE